MKCFASLVAVLAAIWLAGQAGAVPFVKSTFDNDAEGWDTSFGGTTEYKNSGGNPGGYLQGTDNIGAGDTWYFYSSGDVNDGWYMQDFSAAYGGFLRFDLILLGGAGTVYSDVDVTISSYQGGTLAYTGLGAPALNTWTHYDIPLVADAGWVWSGTTTAPTPEQMQEKLATFSVIFIRGEYLLTPQGSTDWDIEGLDNVAIDPIPEPTAALLIAAGLAGLAAARRRRPLR